jgi:hypothetical protein
MTLAHIMGMPVEESLLTLVPAVAAFLAMAGARLRGRS